MNGNYILNGKLQMTDDEAGEFEIVTETGTVNVSSILDNIFDSSLRPQIYIKVMRGNALIFEEDGLVTFCRDKQGVDSFFVCGLNLDKVLWDNTENNLEICIKKRGNTSKYGNIS